MNRAEINTFKYVHTLADLGHDIITLETNSASLFIDFLKRNWLNCRVNIQTETSFIPLSSVKLCLQPICILSKYSGGKATYRWLFRFGCTLFHILFVLLYKQDTQAQTADVTWWSAFEQILISLILINHLLSPPHLWLWQVCVILPVTLVLAECCKLVLNLKDGHVLQMWRRESSEGDSKALHTFFLLPLLGRATVGKTSDSSLRQDFWDETDCAAWMSHLTLLPHHLLAWKAFGVSACGLHHLHRHLRSSLSVALSSFSDVGK